MELPADPGKKAILAEATKRPRIHALTSARFFAALYVIFYHLKWGVLPGSPLGRFLDLGYVAPDFFFLLSGYILAIVYLHRGNEVPAKKFYITRFARIYPLYIATVLADVPFVVMARVPKYGLKIAIERVMALFASSAFMMQMWLPVLTIINIPSWSLAVETVFYLGFPFFGPWLWKAEKKTILSAALVLYAVSVLLNWGITWRDPFHPNGFDLVSFEAIFTLGILLARWQNLRAGKRGATPPTAVAGWCVLVATTAFFVAVVWASPKLKDVSLSAAFLLIPAYMGLIWVLAATRIFPVRLLEAKWLVVLGEASYGLYLIQTPVGQLFDKLHLTGSAKDYPLYLATCIGLSLVSFYFFETPARGWILRRFHSLPKESMEAASAAQ